MIGGQVASDERGGSLRIEGKNGLPGWQHDAQFDSVPWYITDVREFKVVWEDLVVSSLDGAFLSKFSAARP
jgi:hypothetical protein